MPSGNGPRAKVRWHRWGGTYFAPLLLWLDLPEDREPSGSYRWFIGSKELTDDTISRFRAAGMNVSVRQVGRDAR